MAETRNVDSRLVPMQQKPLLLPATCIAEVIDYSRPTDAPKVNDWYLGEVNWRGLSIPLVSFERVNKGRFADFSATARIAVLHSTAGNEQQPFYGVVVQGIPQEMRVAEDEISLAPEPGGPAEMSRVIVKGIPAAIPDLQRLESELAGL